MSQLYMSTPNSSLNEHIPDFKTEKLRNFCLSVTLSDLLHISIDLEWNDWQRFDFCYIYFKPGSFLLLQDKIFPFSYLKSNYVYYKYIISNSINNKNFS